MKYLLVIIIIASLLLVGCGNEGKCKLSEADELYNSGVLLGAGGRSAEAIEAYTKAIEEDPAHIRSYINRGGEYLDNDEYDLTIADCTKAIELHPGYAQSYSSRGLAYMAQGKKSAALADFERLVIISDNAAQIEAAKSLITILSN